MWKNFDKKLILKNSVFCMFVNEILLILSESLIKLLENKMYTLKRIDWFIVQIKSKADEKNVIRIIRNCEPFYN